LFGARSHALKKRCHRLRYPWSKGSALSAAWRSKHNVGNGAASCISHPSHAADQRVDVRFYPYSTIAPVVEYRTGQPKG
jgi:hypothetical protein